MSDISSLSNQYDQLVHTSEKVNDSVVVFKKDSLLRDATNRRKYPSLNLSAGDLTDASRLMLLFIADVFEHGNQVHLEREEFMPVSVKNDYKAKLRMETAYLDEDVRRLCENLLGRRPLTEDDLRFMDMLVTTLDTERNNLFRKLRKARG